MGNTLNTPLVEDQTDQVFTNLVILRQLVGMLPSRDIRNLRRVNKAVNKMACNFLQGRGNAVRKISTGTELRSFLDRMGKRLDPLLCYSSFNLAVCGIPFNGIQRFCVEMAPFIVRVLNIDAGNVPLWWYLLTNLDVGYGSWNAGKVKTIHLLESFPNVEELQLVLTDDDHEENILTPAELRHLPPSFPKLRVLRCTYLDVFRRVLQLQPLGETFLVTIIDRSPNLERSFLELI